MSKYKYSGVVPTGCSQDEFECGGFVFQLMRQVAISKVIYSNPATIVLFDDGTKTVSKCANGDIYSREVGLAICLLKKIIGPTNVHRIFEDWITMEDPAEVNVSDVRKKHKECDVQ